MIIYLHKNIIKKLKRNEQLIASLYTQLVADMSSYLLIEDGPYDNKLCAEYGLIFDSATEKDSFILWDSLEEKDKLTLRATIAAYKKQPVRTLIASNQFIELHVTEETFENDILNILHSNQLELKYILDEEQAFILNQCKNFTNIAYTGNAGSGKTLLLNRIAHDLMYEETPFLYLTFTNTLKEKFTGFLSEELELFPEVAALATFEQFLRKQVAEQIGLDASQYVTFFDCERFVSQELPKLQQSLSYTTLLSVKECARILLTIPTFELDIHKPNGKLSSATLIIERKLKSLQENGSVSCTADDITLLSRLAALFDKQLKKEKKKQWHAFLNEVNKALLTTTYTHPFRYILLDEMQDLGQYEFMLLIKLLGNAHNVQYVITYDENQRIAFEGSTDRSFAKRIEQLNISPLYLKNNYRNAANIKMLAQHFLTESATDVTYSNISFNKVKVVMNPNMEHLLRQLSLKFIPEENLNIGIVAFGQTYSQYYDDFYTPDGKRKYVGIDFYNEEDIKGLEYTNLIILNFFELCQTSKPITTMELRKWYVAITRACDNLLIHVHSIDEYEYVKKQLQQPFFEQENVQTYTVVDDALEQFNHDILVSLGNEQKTILAQEGARLLQAFKTTHDADYFDEAVSIFELLNMQDTLKSILELDFSLYKQQELVALQLCKIAITTEDLPLYVAYIPFVESNHYWQLMKLLPPTAHDWLQHLKGQIKSEAAIKGELNEKGKALKMKQQLDDYIRLYYAAGIYTNILHTYEEQSFTFQKATYKIIAKAYIKQQAFDKAATLYLQHDFLAEFMQLFAITGQYDTAFELLFQAHQDKKNNDYLPRLYELAIKSPTERERLLKQLLTLKNLPAPFAVQVYYELFLLRKEAHYAKLGIELAIQHKLDEDVLLFYSQDHSLAFTYEAIATILQKNKRFRELSQLYNEQENYIEELLALIEAYRHGAAGVEMSILALTEDFISARIDGDFSRALQTVKQDILAICLANQATFTYDFLLYVEAIDEAIDLAFAADDFAQVITLASDYAYSEATREKVAKAYEMLQQFSDAAAIYKQMEHYQTAIKLQPDDYKRKKWIHQLLLPVAARLAKNVDELKEQRLARLQPLLQADFKKSKVANLPLFIEQTVKGWLEILGDDVKSSYILLQDNKDNAEQAIAYLANRPEQVISYYNQYQDMPYSTEAMTTVLQAAQTLTLATEDELAIRERLLTVQMRTYETTAVPTTIVDNIEAVFQMTTFDSSTQLNKLLQKIEPILLQTTAPVKATVITFIYALQLNKLQREEKNLRDATAVLTKPDMQLHLQMFNLLAKAQIHHPLLTNFAHTFLLFLESTWRYQQMETHRLERDLDNTTKRGQGNQLALNEIQQFIALFKKLQKIFNDTEAIELTALHFEELQQQLIAQYGELQLGLQTIDSVTREEYTLLEQVVTADNRADLLADMQNNLKRWIRLRLTNQKNIQEQLEADQRATTQLMQELKHQQKKETQFSQLATKLQTQCEPLLQLTQVKPPVSVSSALFAHVAEQPLIAPTIQVLVEKERAQQVNNEPPTEHIVDNIAATLVEEETPPVETPPSDSRTGSQNETEHITPPVLPTIQPEEEEHSPTEKTTQDEELEAIPDPVAAPDQPEQPQDIDLTLVAERVRVFTELLPTGLPLADIAKITRLPDDIVSLYMDEQTKFNTYLQLVKNFTDEQLVLLSQLQDISVNQLRIIRLFSDHL